MRPAAAGRIAAACLAVLAAGPPAAAPIEIGLDRAAIAEAVRLGRSGGRTAHSTFHAAYRIALNDPIVRHLEVVTEFRRVVLLTEEREGAGDASWDVAQAMAAARSFRGRVELVVQLQFGPQNTYRSMPAYGLVLYDRVEGAAQQPLDALLTPAYVGGQPAPTGTPILSGTVAATFDAGRLAPDGHYLAALLLDGREVRRVPVNLRDIR